MTGLLVRSVATGWVKNSVLAVDAGVHLAAIIRIINEHLPKAAKYTPPSQSDTGRPELFRGRQPYPQAIPGYFSPIPDLSGSRTDSPGSQVDPNVPKLYLTTGPFKNLVLPFENAKANAVHLLRHFISTYLITHPHLDHISGFAVNTAAFQHTSRPKKLAALPSTIDAIKAHIFNDVIWPNLSDEEGGAGLVSFQRLTEGGNLALGVGEGRGYVEVCDGLAVKAWPVSHGHCTRKHQHRATFEDDHNYSSPSGVGGRRGSRASIVFSPGGPNSRRRSLGFIDPHYACQPDRGCVTESSAYFIRDEPSGREILVFGDVEPDSISFDPRTARVWTDAAPKLLAGLLAAIFIECSYDDSQPDETLFGHLAPRHLVAELENLAKQVRQLRHLRHLRPSGSVTPGAAPNRRAISSSPPRDTNASAARKRKRPPLATSSAADDHGATSRSSSRGRSSLYTKPRRAYSSSLGPTTERASHDSARESSGGGGGDAVSPSANHALKLKLKLPPSTYLASGAGGGRYEGADEGADEDALPLSGLKIVVIHVKDTLQDGPQAGEIVQQQLRDLAAQAGLGCEISVAKTGEGLWI